MQEVYALFQEQYPGVKIGLSKFFELKPANVIHMAQSPSDQCKCIQHDTFRMMLIPFKVKVDSTFWSEMLCEEGCDDVKSACWLNECEMCRHGKKLHEILSNDCDLTEREKVTWYKWELMVSVTKKGKSTKRYTKILAEGCVGELKEKIFGEYPKYISHVRRKRIMAGEYQTDLKHENASHPVCSAQD